VNEPNPPQVSEQWLEQVTRELRGADYERSLVRRTLDGIEQKPVYDRASDSAAHGLPGQAPFRRGSRFASGQSRPWQICSRIDATAPAQANVEALEELAGGADALCFTANAATRLAWSTESTQDSGIDLGGADAVSTLLSGIQTELISLHLDAGALAPSLAELVLAELDQRGKTKDSRIHAGCDPLASLAADGEIPCSVVAARRLTFQLLESRRDLPLLRVFRADGLAVHSAGASEASELGVILASVAEWLRSAEKAEVPLVEVAARLDLRVGVAREVFVEIGKIRALRELWSRLLEVCGIQSADQPAPFVHAVASPRTLSQRDPWTNLLRSTTQGFAAAIAGADAITLLPMDAAFQRPGSLSRRMARNTQLVLAEEGHIGEICDPAGGSFAIERWTDDLVEAGWEFFQQLESRGGLQACLESGWLADHLADTRERRLHAISHRKEAITGVSEFPVLDEQLPEPGISSSTPTDAGSPEHALPQAWSAGLAAIESPARPFRVERCLPFRDAEAFEALRDAADSYSAQYGQRPTIYLATLGDLAQHNARAGFASNLFAAGGFAVERGDGVNGYEPKRHIAACLCGSDAGYEEFGEALHDELMNLGDRPVLLAGKANAWAKQVIFMSCDALGILRELHATIATSESSEQEEEA